MLQYNQLEVTNIDKASLINHEDEGWKVRPPDKGNEVINGSISPHNDLNVDKFHQEKTEIKTEENITEKEPESGDEIEKEVIQTKIKHRKLSVQPGRFINHPFDRPEKSGFNA